MQGEARGAAGSDGGGWCLSIASVAFWERIMQSSGSCSIRQLWQLASKQAWAETGPGEHGEGEGEGEERLRSRPS
jgi:hypothetical protein